MNIKTVKNTKKDQYIRTFNHYEWLKELSHGSLANYYLMDNVIRFGEVYACCQFCYNGEEQLFHMNICDYQDTFTI